MLVQNYSMVYVLVFRDISSGQADWSDMRLSLVVDGRDQLDEGDVVVENGGEVEHGMGNVPK